MPPRIRAVRASKASNENNNIITKNKLKTAVKTAKPARKPLADKTNSASDENASPEFVKKVSQKSTKSSRKVTAEERPRRNRRLPTRYVENQVLSNLSNSKDSAISPSKLNAKTPPINSSKVESPFKSPINLDNSLLANRPRRVSRLPSKFDCQSESPNKVTIQPCHTSTPLLQKTKNLPKNVPRSSEDKQKGLSNKELLQTEIPQKILQPKVSPQKVVSQKAKQLKVTHQKSPITKVVPQKVTSQSNKQINEFPQKTKHSQTKLVQKKLTDIVKDDIHTNIDTKRARRLRKPVEYKEITLSPKLKSPETTKSSNTNGKKTLQTNTSIRVLEDKKKLNNRDNLDVYEFTFDPTQEPPPQKKKKKVTNKRQAKPKIRVYNNNYEKNLARALADLKNTVNKKTEKVVPSVAANNNAEKEAATQPLVHKQAGVVICTTAEIHNNPDDNKSVKSNVVTKNHTSIRVQDIAADFEATIDHHDDINYSPVNSPHCNDIEPSNVGHVTPDRETIQFNDPLNLRNELSFFDEQPVASSSMNMSTRNPTATPWRVEFENLPIKWQANTYVKPDMTPALESSYINQFDDGKKKHVYTNMIAQENDVLPDIVENEAPKLKQTSIISFIKEVIERSASKKKKSIDTPKKGNSLFDEPKTSVTAVGNKTPSKDMSDLSKKKTSKEDDTSGRINKVHKRKNDGDLNPTPAKVPRNDKENTLFGFDDSENQQENMSPLKIVNNNRLRNLRSRSGAALKELNKQTGPMRVDLPAAMKTKMAPSSDIVEKMFDQMKSATDAPMLLDAREDEVEATNVTDEMPVERLSMEEDSQSVHLFEDIELVHHLKVILNFFIHVANLL